MDRIREARRNTMAANGLTRRRHRTNSLRDSPDDDGAMEMQEPTRLRDRGSGKKDRDRERERERDRLGRNKRRRGDRLMHGVREDGGEDTSEESINDEEEDDDDDDHHHGGGNNNNHHHNNGGVGGGGGGSVRMLPLNNPSTLSSSSSLTNHHRKNFPPAKVFRPTPPTTWKAADEMIGVSIPRKARSASTKRSHECWASSGGGIVTEQNHRQPSSSPVRASAAPPSPSSSNASIRKKMKANGGGSGGGGGTKFRPPKSSSKSSSSVQDEIEIEIAEVLYGMMRQPQSQVPPSKQEMNDSMKMDSRETNNNKSSASDAKSRISSPPQNSSSSATPVSATAPKRKRPRPVKHEDENPAIFSVRSSPVSSISKAESDHPSKIETSSSNSDKNNQGSVPENSANLAPVQASPEPVKPDSNTLVVDGGKVLMEESEKQKDVGLNKEVVVPPVSPKKESSVLQAVDDVREDVKATKANPPTIPESENQLKEKFQIDLMAPPPSMRSSPERVVENNSLVVEAEKAKLVMKEDQKSQRMNKDDLVVVETEKVKAKAEENESQKAATVQKERGIDLQLELEKTERVDSNGNGNLLNKKQQHQNVQRHHHQLQQQQQQQTNTEKNVQSNSLPIPMSVPSWPGGLPSMGYMTPLQGVVSMDGTTMPSAAIPPPHLLFNQPRPKKCATHCYIARNILYNQQIARMNPFWPAAAAGSAASLYGAKPGGNLSVIPSTELHGGNVPGRATNSTQDKGHSLAMFPGHIGKDKTSQPSNVDNNSRKQILLQQTLPPGAAPNILHGPTFIFPLNQQQAAAAAAAASVRPGSVKSLPVTSNGPPSSTSNSAQPNTSGTGAAAAPPPTMSFTYPNMPGNETQYMAILQNNAYPFPIPAHVGGPPGYRGNPTQAFPFFNGSFYSSQMINPSQIQPQQLPAQSQQSQQGHPNATISTGSSSQKHAQNQQQKANNVNGSNGGGSGSLQGFPVTKNPHQQLILQQQQQQQQQRQQLQSHHTSNAARQVESEMGCEDSPSTADSRLNRATMNIYGQNFAMPPMQTPNFTLMTTAMSGGGSNGNHSEKKQQQQHPGSKAGGETSPAFAMPFASINGATGLDLSSIAHNHSIMQNNHNYHIMAQAHAQAASAHLKKSYNAAEEGKHVVNSSNLEEDRKAISGKNPATVGQSIAFSRSDVGDASMSSLAGNNVIDNSGRSLNLGSASSRASVSVMPAAINTNAAGSQQQMQRNQQQILQLQKQNQFAVAAAASSRNKTPSTSNGSIYSDNLPSTSSISAKYTNAVSPFPQSLVQSSNTVVTQSPQWKNSARTATNTSMSPSTMASPPSLSVKNPPQQQARSQQGHTQISFAANPKSSAPQVQTASSTQSPSPPVMVGSPTNSSMSKNTSSPRTTHSTSTNNKTSQASSLSSQQAKNSPTMPTRKSSPVGGRNVPSILSGPQITPSSNTGSKSQLSQQQQKQQQQQQQQISKQNLQQAQMFFSNPYMHPQVTQSNSPTSTASPVTGYYPQRRGPDQVQRQGSGGTSSNGATANNNSKGSTLNTQGLLLPSQFAAMQPSGNHHQFVPAGFYNVQPVPTAVQVKPAEQKQPAGE